MKGILLRLSATLFLLSLALAAPACAEESENLEADANAAENHPPVISHKVADNATGEDCLVCHKTGIKGAPPTSHPLRLNCTQCHVRSDLGEPKTGKKGKKGK